MIDSPVEEQQYILTAFNPVTKEIAYTMEPMNADDVIRIMQGSTFFFRVQYYQSS